MVYILPASIVSFQDRRWIVFSRCSRWRCNDAAATSSKECPAQPSPAQPSPALPKRATTGDIFQYDSSSSAAPLTKQYHCCWVKYGLWTCFILTLSVQTMLSRAQGTTTKLRFYSMNCESLHNVIVRFEAWAATRWRDYHQDIKMWGVLSVLLLRYTRV